MSTKHNVTLVIVSFIIFALASFGWVSMAIAGTFIDEFESTKLDEDYWEMKSEGGASYEIADGELTMTSPSVPDGILLYYNKQIGDEDFSVEIKAKIAKGTNNAGVIAFLKKELPPTLNTTINAQWLAELWCGENTPGWYINNDAWNHTNAKGPEFEGTWKVEIKGDEIYFYFNDEEVVVVDKLAEERYLCFGPDTYTSHYSGEMSIDMIKLSGPTVMAVQPKGRLSVVWGKLKSRF